MVVEVQGVSVRVVPQGRPRHRTFFSSSTIGQNAYQPLPRSVPVLKFDAPSPRGRRTNPAQTFGRGAAPTGLPQSMGGGGPHLPTERRNGWVYPCCRTNAEGFPGTVPAFRDRYPPAPVWRRDRQVGRTPAERAIAHRTGFGTCRKDTRTLVSGRLANRSMPPRGRPEERWLP